MNKHGIAVVLAGLLAVTSGCVPAAPPKPAAVVAPAPAVNVPEQPPAPKQGIGGIARTMEITEVRALMQQLGLAYQNYELSENRAPKDRQDLSRFYENNGKINEVLDKGIIIFAYGVKPQQMPAGAAGTILAYEAIADQAGIRVVLMGNGQARAVDEATFAKLPKAGAK